MLTKKQLKEALEITDLTDEKNGINPIVLILRRIRDCLENVPHYPSPEMRRAHPLTTIEDNFDLLLIPESDLCRSPIYTRYTEDGRVLRTQGSAMISPLLRERPIPDDRLLICPGIVYRRDVIDRMHSGTHHQMDVWRIKKGDRQMGRGALIELIETIIFSVFPGAKYRVNEKTHPYTLNGVEIEVLYKDNWVETLEGGEIHPQFLRNVGIDPTKYSGLATGFGLDRLAMMVKNMDDIRLFRASDPRIIKQMQNLDSYVSVSKMPSMVRDISIVVSADITEEDICEKIRSTGKENVDIIEEIKVLSETNVDDLSSIARERLGARLGQKNMLIRMIFRSIDRTLKKEDADMARDAAYLAVHESEVKTLIRN